MVATEKSHLVVQVRLGWLMGVDTQDMMPVVNAFELVVEGHIGFGIPQIDYVEFVVNDSVDGLES